MSGTDRAHGTTEDTLVQNPATASLYAPTRVLDSAIGLRAAYAMSGTDAACATTDISTTKQRVVLMARAFVPDEISEGLESSLGEDGVLGLETFQDHSPVMLVGHTPVVLTGDMVLPGMLSYGGKKRVPIHRYHPTRMAYAMPGTDYMRSSVLNSAMLLHDARY
eukprot:1000565-Rhodomonas_salina.4